MNEWRQSFSLFSRCGLGENEPLVMWHNNKYYHWETKHLKLFDFLQCKYFTLHSLFNTDIFSRTNKLVSPVLNFFRLHPGLLRSFECSFSPFLNSLTSIIPCSGPNNGEASSHSVSKNQPSNICRSEGALFFRSRGWLSDSSEQRRSQPFRRCLRFAWKTPPSHTHKVFSASAWENRPWANERHHNTFVFLGNKADGEDVHWRMRFTRSVTVQAERCSLILPPGGNNA